MEFGVEGQRKNETGEYGGMEGRQQVWEDKEQGTGEENEEG